MTARRKIGVIVGFPSGSQLMAVGVPGVLLESPPNKRLQATASSLRSCLAAAFGGA